MTLKRYLILAIVAVAVMLNSNSDANAQAASVQQVQQLQNQIAQLQSQISAFQKTQAQHHMLVIKHEQNQQNMKRVILNSPRVDNDTKALVNQTIQ
jgi:TolA-binding protein